MLSGSLSFAQFETTVESPGNVHAVLLTLVSDDRIDQLREFLLAQPDTRDLWLAALDPDVPPTLAALQSEAFDAYERGDVEWILEHADPEVEIAQPPELPGARTYHGRDGMLEALLDWPREWENFRLEPRRVFAIDDESLIVIAIHRGRARQIDIDVEAEIVWLFRWRDRRLVWWPMFMTVEAAIEAAQQ